MRRALAGLLLVTATASTRNAAAQKVEDLDPHVKVTVTTSSLKLSWDVSTDATSWSLRKREGKGAWTTLEASLPAATTSYEDKAVTVGKTVEYNVQRRGSTNGNAYVLAGIDVPFPDDVGVVALVVDDVTAKQVATLEDDLAREGYDVVRVVVSATDKPEAVKAKLQALRTQHGERFRTAFLLGTVPRAFSGAIFPDGHSDHRGAWPADGYYADLDGKWPDIADLGGEGTFLNKPGDGKFDPSSYPTDLELAIGRVDFFDMPAFAPLDEQGLLKRYLEADHAFRSAAKTYGARSVVSDNFGYFSGEAFARLAWRDSYAIYGSAPESGKPIFDALEDPAGYGLAFGCGGGNPTGAGGVGSTNDFVKRAPRAVFFGLFGSYFGDWAYRDNFLRGALGSSGGVLATAWFARPWHHLHPLGAMQTFGETMLATMNNSGSAYDTGNSARSVHLALLGDPTLRLFVARAPTQLEAANKLDALTLTWTASPDADSGYAIYRREGDKGWARLATVTATSYADTSAVDATTYRYRVVAVNKKTTASGTFFLHSPGPILEKQRVVTMNEGDSGTSDPDAGALPEDSGLPADSALAEDSGCGCRTARAPNHAWLGIVLLGVTRWRRGRRSVARRSPAGADVPER